MLIFIVIHHQIMLNIRKNVDKSSHVHKLLSGNYSNLTPRTSHHRIEVANPKKYLPDPLVNYTNT